MVGKRERNPISRRLVGGTMWRDAVSRALRLEEEQVGALRLMMQQTDNADKLRTYGGMLAAKVEVITILNELLRYSNRKGQDDDS